MSVSLLFETSLGCHDLSDFFIEATSFACEVKDKRARGSMSVVYRSFKNNFLIKQLFEIYCVFRIIEK